MPIDGDEFVIGIETSGLVGGVALVARGECLEERTLGSQGRRHAQSLVLELHELLNNHGLKPADVFGIAVSQGPGSFTGLRVGMVCAKTFAYAASCRFASIDTFAAIAENCPADVSKLWVTENAQRGDLFVGLYERDVDGPWKRNSPIRIESGEEWFANRQPNEVVTGPGLNSCELELVRCRCLTDEAYAKPKARMIAQLGWRELISESFDPTQSPFDFWRGVPFYLRPSAAEEKDLQKTGKP
ncbi:MAG: tRNA (adenosine(37)-N6)-threonylcarbamoyltransferase complex dimerization subunit type 1 TsaB [Planctomycetes bacterium]|nr:tRNA (adenosine(37)-N6)-threonylcarbamoyltransferase complex dimerization subunit type 1 TsaB [Planctomycetota bacterium]